MILFLKNLMFTLCVPGVVAGLVPWWIAGDAESVSGALRWTASLLFVLGGAIYLWCVWDFASFGLGTPAPIDAPRKLVVRGLYRWVRNPMYLGVLTVICAWSFYLATYWLLAYGVAVAAMFHCFTVFFEEPQLESDFGDEYALYRARVERWLPRIPRSR